MIGMIQARMSSARLPGKVMADIHGEPMLQRMYRRLRHCNVGRWLVLTSVHHTDDIIADWCAENGIGCVRGPLHDVLTRFYHAHILVRSKHIVRVTADCPLIDPAVVNQVIYAHRDGHADFSSNVERRTYPDGLDVEVFSDEMLRDAYTYADLPEDREHVCTWMRRHAVNTAHVTQDRDMSHLKWSVDLPEDLAMVRDIFAHVGPLAGQDEILAYVNRRAA